MRGKRGIDFVHSVELCKQPNLASPKWRRFSIEKSSCGEHYVKTKVYFTHALVKNATKGAKVHIPCTGFAFSLDKMWFTDLFIDWENTTIGRKDEKSAFSKVSLHECS